MHVCQNEKTMSQDGFMKPCFALDCTLVDDSSSVAAKIFTKATEVLLELVLQSVPAEEVEDKEGFMHRLLSRPCSVRLIISHSNATNKNPNVRKFGSHQVVAFTRGNSANFKASVYNIIECLMFAFMSFHLPAYLACVVIGKETRYRVHSLIF